MSAANSQVVVGFDFTPSGRAALDRATALAARAPFHVLHIVCVLEPHAPIAAVPGKHVDIAYAERVQAALTAEVKQELEASRVATRVHFYIHVRIGKPAQEILGVARDVGADLIIVGSQGRHGVERLVLGSVSEHVVREAQCTVEVARPKTYAEVALLQMVEVEPTHHYIPPHRYSYEDNRVMLRPPEWPLY
jgi:nucleotide-binding universal stress UspA family protein